MIKITSQELLDFSRYIADICGITLDRDKKYLLENRLQSVLDEQKFNSFYELLFSAKDERNGSLRSSVIDAIATNETYFFRDRVPFEILKYKILPDTIDRKKKQNLPNPRQIRIWCAACSTGQEVYSVLMSIMEIIPDIRTYDIRVLGTDISSRVIAQASSGRYAKHEIERGLSAELRNKYFVQENDSWRIRDELRSMADFRQLNLLEPFYGIGPFDIIFCRNVSIYFSEQNKVKLFKKIGRILDRNGFLIVGGSESLNEVAPQFTCQRHMKGMFYQRKDADTLPILKKNPSLPVSPVSRKETVVVNRPHSTSGGSASGIVWNNDKLNQGHTVTGRNRIEKGTPHRFPQPPEISGTRSRMKQLYSPPGGEKGQADAADEPPTDTAFFALLKNDRNELAGEQSALLRTILGKQQQNGSLLAAESNRKGERGRSLLDLIYENNKEKTESKENESGKE